MKKIKLTLGKEALVDDNMFDFLNRFRWFARADGKRFYATKHIGIGPRKTCQIMMNWMVIGCPPHGMDCDHIDGNSLNNQRNNLRIVSRRTNLINNRKRRYGLTTSKYPGVSWSMKSSKWRAQAFHSGKWIWLGLFEDERDASKAYEKFVNSLDSK